MPKLVQINADYSDEFYVHGWAVMENDEFEEWKNTIISEIEKGNTDFWFGTNEFIGWYSKEEFLREMSVKAISDFDCVEINRLFGKSHGGWIP